MRRSEAGADLGARNRRLARGQVGHLRAVERAVERKAQSLERPRDELELEAIALGAANVGREQYRELWHRVREIGRGNVGTPVTIAHLVCRLLLEKKKKQNTITNTNT